MNMRLEAAPEDEYEAVQGLDQDTIACQRSCEAVAAAKTASDYEHIVWAYGVLWSLFAVYGILLWWRANKQRVEVGDLDRRLRALEEK